MFYIRTILIYFCGFYLQAFTVLSAESTIADNTLATTLKPVLQGTTIEPVLTLTHQSINQDELSSETLYSIDIAMDYSFKTMGLAMMLEQSKHTKNSGISSKYSHVNSDAGTTTRRIQLSEFYVYGQLPVEGGNWQLGLAEVSSLIDVSAIANDEVSQFLSAGLINNQTIVFPDYAISARIEDINVFGNVGYRLLLSSGEGIEETNGDYRDLLSISRSGKGMFRAMELVTQGEYFQGNFGIWKNTNGDQDQTGIYTGMDIITPHGGFNIRMGWLNRNKANEKSESGTVKNFYSISYLKVLTKASLGIGFNLNKHLGESVIISRAWETYYRLNITPQVYLTPSLQWFSGSQYTGTKNTLLTSMRLEVYF